MSASSFGSDRATNIDFPHRMLALDAEFSATIGDFWLMVVETGSLADAREAGAPATAEDFDHSNPHGMAARQSFVPPLGETVWDLPKAFALISPFSACTYELSDGRQIGYVRVPHYTLNEGAISVFAQLIARFETTTAAMVFDQVNNPGGNMFHMYALLSHLTDKPLALPQHQLTLDESDAARAAEDVAKAESDEEVAPEARPSPERLAYSRFVLSEIEAGRGRLTNPVHLGGVAEILPAKIKYTKKIVVLINELDFSAGEFLAAILQDNQRATLFGQRTAGAGGCARRLAYPISNRLGIESVSYRWTLARRINGQLIEREGVDPDVKYSLTAEDLQSGYPGYRRALLATVSA